MNQTATIHTGSMCLDNPGPGGFASILRQGRQIQQIAGRDTNTTPQRAEMMAIVEALHNIPEGHTATVHSASSVIVHTMTQNWRREWSDSDWATPEGRMILDHDLWQDLIKACQSRHIAWVHLDPESPNHDLQSCLETAEQQARRAKQDLLQIQAASQQHRQEPGPEPRPQPPRPAASRTVPHETNAMNPKTLNPNTMKPTT